MKSWVDAKESQSGQWTDWVGGREGGGIPGVTLRQGAEAEPPPSPLLFQEIVAPYVT